MLAGIHGFFSGTGSAGSCSGGCTCWSASCGSACSTTSTSCRCRRSRVRRRGRRPATSRSTRWPAGAVVVPLGGHRHLRDRHPHHGRHQGLLCRRLRQDAPTGSPISLGMLLGMIMILNVWGVIWRNQKVVLANAANVLAGGEADPAAAAAGRKAYGLAARTPSSRSRCCSSWCTPATVRTSAGSRRGAGGNGASWRSRSSSPLVLESNALGDAAGTQPDGQRRSTTDAATS